MICVSIGRGRHRHVVAEHKHLVEQGAQLVELRLDYINGQINLRRVLADRPGPVIVTIRRPQDGGKFTGTEEQRRMLLRTAIAEGVDYIDLEHDVAGQIPRYGKTKRIVSLHDFRKTPEDLEAIHARLAALDADIVKLATLANNPHDNLRMLRLIRQARIPTVGICMGDIGIPSRILAGRFGAPFTYATFHHERTLAPGQLSFEQMREVYRYDELNADTEVYGVIGDPIAHSFSPLIHNAGFKHLGLNKVYVPFRVAREHLDAFLDDAAELGIRGLSVTIPHKEAVLRRLAMMDGAVKGIGAANTVLFGPEGLQGHNTDYRGAMEALAAALEGNAAATGERRPDLRHKTALVLGAS
ncbi:MAG: type I 3-dehydroquinate dehydratase, partial [Pirellulales bacterium]|nr:type I 3-dehydroquinate dehydratase [Pirellulales bacterium]